MLTNSEVIAPGGNKKRFDVVINAIGYEDRARFSVESDIVSANNYISLAFEKTSLFGYSKNIEIMTVLGASIIERVSLQTENDAIDKKIRELHEGKPLNIACDISSMNRSMISAVFRALIRNLDIIRSASIIYTPAKFSPPSSDYPQIDQIGPVTPELSGYQSAPSLPIGLLIGLGYEFGIAAGILNGLEPKLTIAFRAVGNDPRYEKAVRTANFNFAFGISRCDVTDYSLMRPDQAARYVDDILASMTRQYRCVLVPMGPKLFEPRRLGRRPFGLSYAAIAGASSMAWYRSSASAGGMFPMGSRRRRLLNQSTHSSVANSTASKLRHGPRRWMTSAL